ncbi:MAG: hypothetical protein IPM16_15895 [Chloroflexi bacterium]|nr:hypothetical protein [Chloroflexota bacterium]
MRRLAAAACLVLMATGVFAQDEMPPYIYYPTDDGYVIERADGTDSRIITAELGPDVSAFGGTWSASGRWLMGGTRDSSTCGMSAGPNGLVLAGPEGGASWTFSQAQFAWSPVVDRVLILTAGAPPGGHQWLVIDPSTPDQPLAAGELTWTFASMRVQWIGETALIVSTAEQQSRFTIIGPDLHVREAAYDFPVVALLPEGRALIANSDRGGIVVEQLDLPDGPLGERSGAPPLPFTWVQDNERWLYADALYSHPLDWDFLQVLGDGRFLFRTPEGLTIRDDNTGAVEPIAWDFEAYSTPQISPDERLIAHIYDGPVIVDRTTGEATYVPPTTLSFMGNLGGRVEWHPTQNWLISVEDGPAYCASTSFTQVTDGTYRREIEACGSRAGCVQWLPEHVDPSQFPPYERPSEPRPYAVLNAGDWVHSVVWSADGATLFTYGSPEPIVAFDVSTREIDPSVDFPHPPDRINGAFQDHALLAESANYAATLAGLFDKRTGQVVLTYADDIWVAGGRFEIGGDERFMISAGMTQPLQVWSLEEMRLVYEGQTTTAAALSSDGGTVAVAAGWEVRLYDLSALVD